VLTREIDSSMRAHANVLQAYMYGDGSGALAQVASVTSPNVVTLKDKTMVARFMKNMKISSCADLTGGTPATAVKITAVNLSAGTLTFDTAYPTGTAADWYLFVDGAYNNVPVGLEGWNPVTAPTSGDSFLGVDRTADVTRLSGTRIGALGQGVMDTLTLQAYQAFANAGEGPDTVFLHPSKYAQLISEIQGQSIFTPDRSSPSDAPDITYQAAKVQTAWGEIRLHPDVFCPSNIMRMMKFDTLTLHVQKDLVSIIEDDNQRILRTTNDDSVEIRMRSYINMGCSAAALLSVADFSQAQSALG
jgi:hypothetical protein